MALRALLDYAAEKGASVVSADVRVPSAPTAVLAGGAAWLRDGSFAVIPITQCALSEMLDGPAVS